MRVAAPVSGTPAVQDTVGPPLNPYGTVSGGALLDNLTALGGDPARRRPSPKGEPGQDCAIRNVR